MSYQVIARKYRPQRFEDVVGQEHVTQTLANAIRSGRIAHAYLFCGPRGTGKTTLARIFAKALNCTGGPKADFDDSDPRCREIAEGRSLDVFEIDGASNNGVEQVRELRDTARFAPASSKFKLYIIDEVHMLTTAAFNALLKTLEEPPAHVKFIFATTDPEKVLPTILSRCQRFDLRRIPAALIMGHLETIAKAEGVTLDPAALHAIARGADGGMRDAESTLDQLISFCGNRIEEADVLSMFGLAARGQILGIARAILQADATAALRELNELARNGKDLGRLLNDLLHHLRNLMVFQVAGGDLGMLEVSELEANELKTQAELAPQDAVARILDVLSAAEGRLRDASARKIFLEVTLMKAIQARNAVSLDLVIRQLQQLREEGGGPSVPGTGAGHGQTPKPAGIPTAAGAPATKPVAAPPASATPAASPPALARPPIPAAEAASTSVSPAFPAAVVPPAPAVASNPAPAPAPAPAQAALATASAQGASTEGGGAEGVEAIWAQIIGMASPFTRSALQAGRPVSLERGILTISYAEGLDSQCTVVDTDRVRRGIESKLAEMGRPATLRFVRGGSPPAGYAAPSAALASAPEAPRTAPTAPAPGGSGSSAAVGGAPKPKPEKVVPIKLDPVEFKNDPLIKEAIELFKGQLVEVRRPEEPSGGA